MNVGWIELLVGLLVLVLFLVLVAGAVVAAIWYSRRGVSAPREPRMPPPGALTTQEDALETVRRRYARGEITREEYLEIRQELMNDRV
ncbi:MAG TPA: SHOCT domain-containing protein [Anaerolineae bacterium]|jgi:putative membrane protein|nr:SHOCT domain-containing protein [Anaerolineae bacterium]